MTDQTRQSAVNSEALRRALRREKLAARAALPAGTHARASGLIREHLCGELLARPPATIAFCAPFRGEVDCRPAIERLLAAGWRAAMPVVVAPAQPMIFRAWSPASPMTVDPHGIPIPDNDTAVVPEVILLPLLAFDATGYRLGYGGGYFDRTLAALRPHPLAVGVGFAFSEVASIHPAHHDVPLDAVVTECGWRNFNIA